MMDKKEIEKYIKLYPRIDEEIKSLEDDLKFFGEKKIEYSTRNFDDIIPEIDKGISEKKTELSNMLKAKIKISIALTNADNRCRNIIDLHFWKHKSWDDVGSEMSISGKHAQRVFSEFLRDL